MKIDTANRQSCQKIVVDLIADFSKIESENKYLLEDEKTELIQLEKQKNLVAKAEDLKGLEDVQIKVKNLRQRYLERNYYIYKSIADQAILLDSHTEDELAEFNIYKDQLNELTGSIDTFDLENVSQITVDVANIRLINERITNRLQAERTSESKTTVLSEGEVSSSLRRWFSETYENFKNELKENLKKAWEESGF